MVVSHKFDKLGVPCCYADQARAKVVKSNNILLNLFSKKSFVGHSVLLLLFVPASNSSGSRVCGKILFPALQKQKLDVVNVFSLFL